MERFRSAAHKFAEISPIHGFSYIANRRTLVEGIIWFLALLIFTAFGVHDTINLVHTYFSEPTAVSIKMYAAPSLNLNNAAVCIGISRWSLWQQIAATFSEADFNATLATLATQINDTFDLSILDVGDAQTDLVLKSAFIGLMEVVDFDIYGVNASSLNANPFVESTRAAALAMNFFLRTLNFDLPKLTTQVASFLCKQVISSIYYLHTTSFGADNTNLSLCSDAHVTWFGSIINSRYSANDAICFSLRNDIKAIFTSPGDQLFTSVHVERASLIVAAWQNQSAINDVDEVAQITIDMRGGEGLIDFLSVDGMQVIPVNMAYNLGIQIQSKFVALNRSTAMCSADSGTQCVLKCIVNRRSARDGCFPLLAIALFGTPGAPSSVCTTSAPSVNGDIDPWDACVAQCNTTASCEMMSYAFQAGTSTTPGDGSSSISLYQSRYVYPVMTEIPLMELSAFIANFGGIIGVWFGGSLLALVHIPIFFVSTIVQSTNACRCSKKTPETDMSAIYRDSISSINYRLPAVTDGAAGARRGF